MLDVRRWALGVFFLMKRKRIVVMGFMGSMPIAGVVWQRIHYVVGLQRLGHDVFFIEDSARLPHNPETFEVTDEFDYAAKASSIASPGTSTFKNRWAYCARYLPGNPTAGFSIEENPATLSRRRRDPERLRHARSSMTIYLFPIASYTSRATPALSKSRSTRA